MAKKEYWHEAHIIFPKKTIGGNRVRGACYKRDVAGAGGLLEGTIWHTEYATRKEVFEDKLKNG